MPFELLQHSPRKFFVINTQTGRVHSKKRLSKKVALRQLHAIRNSTGEGLLDWAKNSFDYIRNGGKKRLDYKPSDREFLKKEGNCVITRLTVSRSPVESMISKALNWISLGQFQQKQKESAFDKMYHLGLNVDYVDSGNKQRKCVIEKLEVVNISNKIVNKPDTDFIDVPLKLPITINELLDRCLAKIGKDDFYLYEAFHNNCQKFIIDLLSASDLLTPALSDFIKQDVGKLIGSMNPLFRGMVKGITDLGAHVNVLTEGRGLDIGKLIDEVRKSKISGGDAWQDAMNAAHMKGTREYFDASRKDLIAHPLQLLKTVGGGNRPRKLKKLTFS